MMFSGSPEVILLLFFLAILAGFLDTLAGGGGLIVVPALLLTGLSPIQALATNKLQGSFGTLVATVLLLRSKMVCMDFIKRTFFMVFLGSVLGAIVIQSIPREVLQVTIPLVLVVIAVYFLFNTTSEKESPGKIKPITYSLVAAPVIGFYDGAIGPGAGSFFTFSNVVLLGKKLVVATANAKVLNFASNVAALLVFSFSSQVVWMIGLLMAVGTAIGASIGSRVVRKNGAKLIKPVIVVVCVAMLINYIVSVT